MRCKELELSEYERQLLSTPFKDLSPEQRHQVFSISDKIADFNRAQPHTVSGGVVIHDKDAAFRKDGVLSPLDQKSVFTNKRNYTDHLKANGCVEIGNDFNNAKPRTEIRGDYDCRKELAQATYQVMEKHGH